MLTLSIYVTRLDVFAFFVVVALLPGAASLNSEGDLQHGRNFGAYFTRHSTLVILWSKNSHFHRGQRYMGD